MLLGPLSYRIGVTPLSETRIRLAILRKTFKGFRLIYLNEGSPHELSLIIKKYCYATTVCSLPSTDVIIKHSESELKNFQHIQAGVRFQIEQLLPFPSESGVFRTLLSKKKGETTDVFTFVTRTEKVRSLVNNISQHNLIPDRISCGQLDLTNLFTLSLKNKRRSGPLIYFGNGTIQYLLFKNGISLFSRFFESSSREESLHNLQATLEYCEKHYPDLSLRKIYVINPPKNLSDYSLEDGKYDYQEIVPPIFFDLNEEDRRQYGETIGTALGAFNTTAIDFKQKDDSSVERPSLSRLFKKWYLPLTYISLICTGITGATGFYLTSIARSKAKHHMQNMFKDLGQSESKSSIDSPKKCYLMLDKKLKELRLQNDYSLTPDNLAAGTVLASLTALPEVQDAGFSFHEYNYQLIEFPSLSEPHLPYTAQITLKGTMNRRIPLNQLKESVCRIFPHMKHDRLIVEEKNRDFSLSFQISTTKAP